MLIGCFLSFELLYLIFNLFSQALYVPSIGIARIFFQWVEAKNVLRKLKFLKTLEIRVIYSIFIINLYFCFNCENSEKAYLSIKLEIFK